MQAGLETPDDQPDARDRLREMRDRMLEEARDDG